MNHQSRLFTLNTHRESFLYNAAMSSERLGVELRPKASIMESGSTPRHTRDLYKHIAGGIPPFFFQLICSFKPNLGGVI